MWKIKRIQNITEHTVPIPLANGETVYLPPKGILEDVQCPDIIPFEKMVKITHDLTEVGRKRK